MEYGLGGRPVCGDDSVHEDNWPNYEYADADTSGAIRLTGDGMVVVKEKHS